MKQLKNGTHGELQMILIEDDGLWWYVNPRFPERHNMLSPVFNDSALALQWRGRVGHENFGDIEQLTKELTDLQTGVTIVLPTNEEHARAMMRVAMFYLQQTERTK